MDHQITINFEVIFAYDHIMMSESFDTLILAFTLKTGQFIAPTETEVYNLFLW